MFCGCVKRMAFCCCSGVLQMSTRSCCLMVLLSSYIFDDFLFLLSRIERGVFLLSIVSFYCAHFASLLLVHTDFGLLCLLGGLSLVTLCTSWVFALKSILSDINIATPTFFWLLFTWFIFFHPFIFNLHLQVSFL